MKYAFYFCLALTFFYNSHLQCQMISDADIKIEYTNLSERYESLFKHYEEYFRNSIKEKIISTGRLDVLPISVTFGASDNTPYIFFNLTFKGNDHLKYYDESNKITMLNVMLPVLLSNSIVMNLIWKISDDKNTHWTEAELLNTRHVIVRMTKKNGEYFQMYIYSDLSWDTEVCVYQKKYGKNYVSHMSNPKVVGAYELLLFDNPIDELNGKINSVKYIYDFFEFI